MHQMTSTTEELGDLFGATAVARAIPRGGPPVKRRPPLEMKVAGALCRQLRRKQAPREKRRLAHLICLNLLSMLKHGA